MNARTSFRRSRLGVEPLEDRLLLAVDYYLKIEGVDGESAVNSHIEVLSWSFGQAAPAQGGGGGAAAQMNDFHVVIQTDRASAELLRACATGEHFKEAKLTCRRTDAGDPQPYMTFKMKEVYITSYQTGGSSGVPTDSFSINFRAVRMNYFGEDGSLQNSCVVRDGAPVNAQKTRLMVGDYDGDGKADIITLQDLNGDGRREMTGAVAGGFEASNLPQRGISFQPKGPPRATEPGQYPEVKLFDRDKDGKPEQWWITFGPKGPRIIYIDKDENGKPDSIGVDLDADGDTEAALWDTDGDGRLDAYWMDRDGDNHIDPGEHGDLPQF